MYFLVFLIMIVYVITFKAITLSFMEAPLFELVVCPSVKSPVGIGNLSSELLANSIQGISDYQIGVYFSGHIIGAMSLATGFNSSPTMSCPLSEKIS